MRRGCTLPALAQFVQNSDSVYCGCNINNSVKRISSEIAAKPDVSFGTLIDTSAADTDGIDLCDWGIDVLAHHLQCVHSLVDYFFNRI